MRSVRRAARGRQWLRVAAVVVGLAGTAHATCPGSPQPEICNGLDDDCDNVPDNGDPGGGIDCFVGASPEAHCFGTEHCINGVIVCSAIPMPEVCNGLDDDCDGVVDNGLPLGGDCTMPYDTTAYPGDRTRGNCSFGKLFCANGGTFACGGGVAPAPEVCDGYDNDCDGYVDEVGPAPDGIDGSADPADATRHIGDTCGSSVGACRPGQLGCRGGAVACIGSVVPAPEICDARDNDCNGVVDDPPGDAALSVCGAVSSCVYLSPLTVSCSEPCRAGDACPTSMHCVSTRVSGGGEGWFCVPVGASGIGSGGAGGADAAVNGAGGVASKLDAASPQGADVGPIASGGATVIDGSGGAVGSGGARVRGAGGATTPGTGGKNEVEITTPDAGTRAAASPKDPSGCGCRTARGETAPRSSWIAAVTAVVAFWRRRERRKSR